MLVTAAPCFYALGLVRLRRTLADSASANVAGAGPFVATERRQPIRIMAEALACTCVLVLAAAVTLKLDWTVSANRCLGIGSQVLATIAGLVGCARFLAWEQTNRVRHSVAAREQ